MEENFIYYGSPFKNKEEAISFRNEVYPDCIIAVKVIEE